MSEARTFAERHAPGSMLVTASVWPTLVARPEDRPGWAPSPYAYAAHLLGRAPLPEADIATRRGKLLEPIAYQLLEEDHGIICDGQQVWVEHPKIRAGATLDGVDEDGEIIEAKVVDDYDFRSKWDPFPPVWYRLQCQAQLACVPNAERALLCALVVGSRSKTLHVEVFTEPRRPALIARLEEEAERFLALLERDELPDPDPSPSTIAALAKVLALDPEAEVDLGISDEAVMRAERLWQSRLDKAAIEKAIETDENWLRVRMGSASLARIGRLQMTARDISRKGYRVEPTTYRQYQIKEVKDV